MNELIKIEVCQFGSESGDSVDLRDLHAFLGSKQQFSNWAAIRIKEAQSVEGVDYLVNKKNAQVPHQGGARKTKTIEYRVTLDTAKEFGMLERNERGKEIRDFFIRRDKELRALLATPLPPTRDQMITTIFAYIENERGLMRKLAPIGQYGELAQNGRPKTGFRSACYVAAKSRQKEAREVNEKWGKWLQTTLDLCDDTARLQ